MRNRKFNPTLAQQHDAARIADLPCALGSEAKRRTGDVTIQKGRTLMRVVFHSKGPSMIGLVVFDKDTPAHLQVHPIFGSILHVAKDDSMAGKYMQV